MVTAMSAWTSSELAHTPDAAAAELGIGVGHDRFRRRVGQDLGLAAAVSVDGYAFDFRLPGGQVDVADVVDGRGCGQVDRLGHSGIDVALHGSLHA